MQIDTNILKTDEKVAYMLRSLYHRFGYSQYKMRKFEEYELYARNKDFLVSDAIISFTDTSGKLLALKPDVTLSIINNSQDAPGQIQKLYYDENVYRVTKGSRSYREIKQTGLECIGDVTLFEICEVVGLALQSLANITEKHIFEVSHIGLVEAIFDESNISSWLRKKLLACISSKNMDEFNAICQQENLSPEICRKLMVFMENFLTLDDAMADLKAVCQTESAFREFDEFAAILNFIKEMGHEKVTKVNFSLTNDMAYYSGIAFRGYIQGIPTSILSGGQYDKLMEKMGRRSKAIGFAVYLDALKRLNTASKEYDVDILLLHGGYIANAVKEVKVLSKDGSSVRICGQIPDGIRYRRLLTMTDKGVIENGND